MPRLKNTLLVAYADAHVEVSDAASITTFGRREGYIELGKVEERDIAVGTGLAVLSVQAEQRQTLSVVTLPRYSLDGLVDYQLGNTIAGTDGARVVGVTIGMDDEGRAIVSPDLKDRLTFREEEVDRLLRRLADGGLKGRTELASEAFPAPLPVMPGRVKELPPWSYDGPLVDGLVGEPYTPMVPQQIIHVTTNLSVAGSTASGFRLVDNFGNVRGSWVVPAGREQYGWDFPDPIYVSPAAHIITTVTTAGTGAAGLSVQLEVCTT